MEEINETGSTASGTTEIIVNVDNNIMAYSWLQEWALMLDTIIFMVLCLIIFVFRILKR